MINTREMMEALEDKTLVSYGFRSAQSRGRAHPESEPPYRTRFHRDRDRIIHTTAFRRLEYKTQVFVTSEGDYYRTRLTHTIEVAQIGRSLAAAFGVNEVLVEAICLAHDLGHPTFGHAGERTLNALMDGYGGFDHNKQSLRLVEKLEHRYPNFTGLNLSWEVLEGIVKHETDYDVSDADRFDPEVRGTLEAQLANPADELAYTAHDLDDGLRSGLLTPDALSGIDLWDYVKNSIGWNGKDFDRLWRHRLVRRILGVLIHDVVTETGNRLETSGCTTPEDIRLHKENLVGLSPTMGGMLKELKGYLYTHLYQHPRVIRMQLKAERIITALFNAYLAEPRQLPFDEQAKLQVRSLHRVICDYIAGMTDRYALTEYAKLFDPQTSV